MQENSARLLLFLVKSINANLLLVVSFHFMINKIIIHSTESLHKSHCIRISFDMRWIWSRAGWFQNQLNPMIEIKWINVCYQTDGRFVWKSNHRIAHQSTAEPNKVIDIIFTILYELFIIEKSSEIINHRDFGFSVQIRQLIVTYPHHLQYD